MFNKTKIVFMLLFVILGLSFLVFAFDGDFQQSAFCKLVVSSRSYFYDVCHSYGPLGCCEDSMGLEHNSYPEILCKKQNGRFYEGVCIQMKICK